MTLVPNPFKPSGGISATVTSVEKLLLCMFFIISLTGNADTNSPWHTPNPTAPDMLVKLNIHPNISCSHGLLGKLPDSFMAFGAFFLKVLHMGLEKCGKVT